MGQREDVFFFFFFLHQLLFRLAREAFEAGQVVGGGGATLWRVRGGGRGFCSLD